jgi:hypothetical protein
MLEEFWVVGGRYRDTSFTEVDEGGAEAYGPFTCYEDALRSWSGHSARTRRFASVRYSVVVTARVPAARTGSDGRVHTI